MAFGDPCAPPSTFGWSPFKILLLAHVCACVCTGQDPPDTWDVQTLEYYNNDWVYSVSFNQDGSLLASGSGDNIVRVVATSTWTIVQTLTMFGLSPSTRPAVFWPQEVGTTL
ncbi:unnamed protein product [Polarella glacialis]|uniref:Uncharacterized protein n=1 Tax=Polarella glacialis TaxID=89957 RepID=A0A813LIJ0_POLGL|nr:unnamed protein product [Polarella glacialis]